MFLLESSLSLIRRDASQADSIFIEVRVTIIRNCIVLPSPFGRVLDTELISIVLVKIHLGRLRFELILSEPI